jgi:YegS/Rv2252/BmrU family lipid kinase
MKKACLIFESRSSQCQKERDLRLIQQTLLPEFDLEICLTAPDVTADELAQSAIERGFDPILVLGGDGTVSTVVGVLLETDITLGIIPRGTANAFAHSLGIPLSVEAACQLIIKGDTRYVDAAHTNFRTMVSTIGIGFEANAFEIVEQQDKKELGLLSYGFANIEALQDFPKFELELEIDSQTLPLRGAMVTVANSSPWFSVLGRGVGQTVVDDGLLDLTIVNPQGHLNLATAGLSLVKAVIQGEESQHPQVMTARSRSFKITTNPPQKVLIDGELVGTTPLEVTCISKSLKIIAPQSH